MQRRWLLSALLATGLARAAPVAYEIDPAHTYPSFEADHMGISVWRGKLNRSRGSVLYDRVDGRGDVDVTMELASIDFGLDALNRWARGREFLDVARHPTARFRGRFAAPRDGVPTQLVGALTLNGQTHPLTLVIHRLRCIPHPLTKRELCGADASGAFRRDDYGLTAGRDHGFDMGVQLRIQVEALARE